MQDEVDQNEDVHDEDQNKNYEPAFRGVVDAARGILLGFERGIEVLCLGLFKYGGSIVLRGD